MKKTIELYVKHSSNCGGMPLTSYETLSETWTGDSLTIPFGPDQEPHDVIGMCSLIGHPACDVHIVKIRTSAQQSTTGAPATGYLVYGGDWGVRILSEDGDPLYDDYPDTLVGVGRPFVWIEDAADLPADVRAVVSVRTAPYTTEELADAALAMTGGKGNRDSIISRIHGGIQRGKLVAEKVGKLQYITPESGHAFLTKFFGDQGMKPKKTIKKKK